MATNLFSVLTLSNSSFSEVCGSNLVLWNGDGYLCFYPEVMYYTLNSEAKLADGMEMVGNTFH